MTTTDNVGMAYPRDNGTNNPILRPTAFTCKSLSNAETHYNTRKTAWPPKCLSLLFCQGGTNDYRSQAPGSHIQERQSTTIINTTAHPFEDTPIHNIHNLHARNTPYIADWLSRQNHKENEDEKIAGLKMNINTINVAVDISTCMKI